MKLYNDETNGTCATEFWVIYDDQKIVLPIESNNPETYDHSVNLDLVNGTYHVYYQRIEDHQLNWGAGTIAVIRDGENEPLDGEYNYYEYKFTVIISGLEHDGVSITKNATVEFEVK